MRIEQTGVRVRTIVGSWRGTVTEVRNAGHRVYVTFDQPQYLYPDNAERSTGAWFEADWLVVLHGQSS